MTALRAEGCGGGFAAIFKKGGAASAAGCVEGLHRFAQGATALRAEGCSRLTAAGCVEGLRKRVLKMDRPAAGGFLSLTAFQAEGCGIALSVHSEHILKER